MLCPSGQVQIALSTAGTPVCVDASVATALEQGSSQPLGETPANPNAAAAGQWWQILLGSVPGILSGAAGVINAGKGNKPADNIYVMPAPATPANPEKSRSNVIWVVLLAIVVLVVITILFLKRKA